MENGKGRFANDKEKISLYACRAGAAFFSACAIFCACKLAADQVDYIHDSGPVVSVAAHLANGYKDGYSYYHTDPDYFDSLDWTSSPVQEDRSRANDDGSLGEMGLRYYAAHSDSGYGVKIASLAAGDVVTIDGTSYVIEGRGMTVAGAPVREIREMSGNADLILLTCAEWKSEDGSQPEHVVWGRAVDAESLPISERWER